MTTPRTWSLDDVPVTKSMRALAKLCGVTGDDATIRRWHADASRKTAEALERAHASEERRP